MNKLLMYKLMLGLLFLLSCGKEFLDVKQDKKVRTPTTIKDFQSLLDNSTGMMNYGSCHELGIIGSDEHYLLDGRWATLSAPYQRNGYVWDDQIYEGLPFLEWERAYQRILYANIALEGARAVTTSADEQPAWDNLYGSALFFRAWNHYQLAQQFALVYNVQNARSDLGIPLRLESDVEVPVVRSSVQETYDRLVADLKGAVRHLPISPVHKFRPSRPAAYALLARVYMQMDDFEAAANYADSCIALKGQLIDFNEIELDRTYTFDYDHGMSNVEVLFSTYLAAPTVVHNTRHNIDSNLLVLYEQHDLRYPAYFLVRPNGSIVFKGSYYNSSFFTGLAVDEMYLVSAESHARIGNHTKALERINTLRKSRINKDHFSSVSGLAGSALVHYILRERRKELLFRGTRWEDLRRLNKYSDSKTTLIRQIDGKRFELSPESPRWVWPIPDNVIELSNLEQNQR